MSCVVPIIESEPLVDVVNKSAIVTDVVEIFKLDLLKIKIEYLDFISQ